MQGSNGKSHRRKKQPLLTKRRGYLESKNMMYNIIEISAKTLVDDPTAEVKSTKQHVCPTA